MMSLVLDVPKWLKAATFLGVPALIAVYLTLFMTNDLSVTTDRNLQQSVNNSVSITQLEQRVNILIDEQRLTNRFLQQVCLIIATNQEDRRACLSVAR